MIPLYRAPEPTEAAFSAMRDVMTSGRIASGPYLKRFEGELETALGAGHVVAVSDVSAGISLALMAIGIRTGDEVVAPAMCCLSMSAPIAAVGARIRWCDVDPATGCLDADALERSMSSRVKAIVAFDWIGFPAIDERIRAIAARWGVPVLEDASEAFGARVDGRRVGNDTADVTVFSFYPNKPLSTIEGGAVVCRNPALADRVRALRRYGIDYATFRTAEGEINPASDIVCAGLNAYLSEVHSAAGCTEVAPALERVARHQRNARAILDRISAPGFVPMASGGPLEGSAWVLGGRVEQRDHFLRAMRGQGVQASAVHRRNDMYTAFGRSDPIADLPGTKEMDEHFVAIPCGWWLEEDDRNRIAQAVDLALRG